MRTRRPLILILMIALGATATLPALATQAESSVDVLIRTGTNTDAVIAAVESAGGEITGDYDYLNVIAAQIPLDGVDSVLTVAGADSIFKDSPIPMPETIFPFSGRDGDVEESSTSPFDNIPATYAGPIGDREAVKRLAKDYPGAYRLNHTYSNVRALHEKGNTGEGVIVAVIDTGLRPGFENLLGGTVIGCEDMLNPPASPTPGPRIDVGCLDDSNEGHGTFVAGLIAGNALFQFDESSVFLNSVGLNAPGAILDLSGPGKGKGNKSGDLDTIAMIGSAPQANIYALRVFGDITQPGNSQDILAAVERVIELKVDEGVDISVVNMSFGRRTFYAGPGIFQLIVNTLLDNDILPVVAVGNSGPSSLTTASPASSLETLAVAAGSVTHQERIAADVFFNFAGAGPFLRPFEGTQTAGFSSRGPDADGSRGPDVIAAGFGLFGQGLSFPGFDPENDWVSIGNGTSFSTPLVAGTAAALRGRFPHASAREVRNALISTANPDILDDGSTKMDVGEGWIDADAAFEQIQRQETTDTTELPPAASTLVADNIENGFGVDVQSGVVSESTGLMLPGERHEIFFEIPPNTGSVTVNVFNVDPELDLPDQNPFFFLDFLKVSIHSAKTSSIGTGDYFDINPSADSTTAFLHEFSGSVNFVIGDADFDCSTSVTGNCNAVANLEPGILRITLGGDTVNAGRIESEVMVTTTPIARPESTASGFMDLILGPPFPGVWVLIPEGTSEAEFRLSWEGDWAHYPTNDFDMFLFPPSTAPLAAFSLDVPEVVKVSGPEPGWWFVGITPHLGGELNNSDTWTLRVTADGVVQPGF